MSLKSSIKKKLNRFRSPNSQDSFAQGGEDILLSNFFFNRGKGFYVDVGAHHPQLFSNTYYFYLKGWSGINIDAMPNSMNLFRQTRPNDINLEIAISDSEEELAFYLLKEPAFNSFSLEHAIKWKQFNKNWEIERTVKLKTQKLSDVLDKHLPPNQNIDFLSVDVEDFDLRVLRSNNWNKYRPDFVLVECDDILNLAEVSSTDICLYLSDQHYIPVGKTLYNLLLKRIG
jgi:FkbM family methyltransferase